MTNILTDILAIIGVVLNGLPQGLLALTFGFASIPTAMAFFIGAIGNTLTQSVAPISFQAETITYAGSAGKDRSERCTMIFFGAVIMALIGAFGLLTKIVDFIGEDIAFVMMAGVGIILTKAAMDMIKKDKLAGGVSLAAALITYFITRNDSNTLVYTIVISVVASCIANAIFKKEKENIVVVDDKFMRQKFTINANVIMGALGMVCLNIGSNISFGSITASMASSGNYNVDHLTLISSLADMGSSLFGGAPVESIISATASAPHPVWAGVAMMVVIGVILIMGVLPKISKYVPASSIADFLFVLGIFKTVALDAPAALAANAAVGGSTLVVTAVTNPFLGMVAGIVVRMLGIYLEENMKEYTMELCGITRTLSFIPINETMAFASFVVLGDTELVAACAPKLAEMIGPVDAILTAEAKGIALAYEVSKCLGLNEFIVARKSEKSYMKDVVSASVHSITTTGEQHLYLDGVDASKIKNKRICIIDDVISTGESLHALEVLAQNAGAEVVKKAALLAEGNAANREDIVFLKKLPLFTKTDDGYGEMK